MRHTILAGTFMLAGALVACGGNSVKLNPDAQPVANRWNATLATPRDLAGAIQVRGTAWMAGQDGNASEASAHVQIMNATPGGEHPWHVHRGQCGRDLGILGAADAYPILKVGGDGTAAEDAKLSIPVPHDGQYFVNVHASSSNMGTIVACGNLAPPTR